MVNRKIEAIAHLEQVFNVDPKYRKDWTDSIEIIVTEELEPYKMKLQDLKKVRTKIANSIIERMFSADWWKAQL